MTTLIKCELLGAVFAALQRLEKSFHLSKEVANRSVAKSDSGEQRSIKTNGASLETQEDVLTKMRRTANKLQIELAKDNWPQAVRLLKIFYGLNHMIRPEVQSSFSKYVHKLPETKPLAFPGIRH